MIYRCILAEWAKKQSPHLTKVLEGEFTETDLVKFNDQGYNIYYLPNYPSIYDNTKSVSGKDIDTFSWIFVDYDLKQNIYSEDSFIDLVLKDELHPTSVVKSGHGIHVYWKVNNLDCKSYLRFQKRLIRKFRTDESVCTIYQLMRLPGFKNTKQQESMPVCEVIYSSDKVYDAEQIDKALPNLTSEDEQYCIDHYNKVFNLQESILIDETLPIKFSKLVKENREVKTIWSGGIEDRSKGDYRLAHIMYAQGFTKEEAYSVIINSAKALSRDHNNRVSYTTNLVDKVWSFEDKTVKTLSTSVKDILSRGETVVNGTRFACNNLIDDTHVGFRLGHVIGLVAGSGVGKTSMAINMFKWFTERNPDYVHFFVSLEQTDNEIAQRWKTICKEDDRLHDKVHVLSNYDEDGNFRHLSLEDIKNYILSFQKTYNKKVGTCVIDHIGVLCKPNKNGQNQAVADICHQMKSFAIETNTLVVMQSQAPREKAGIGDLELNKDAAYGTVFFESYVDWLLTIWQPLKRCYNEGAPTIMAFKYCKIRHKKQHLDNIKEDICYNLYFDPATEELRELTENEEKSFTFFNTKCVNKRKQDRKTEVLPYVSRRTQSRKSVNPELKR